MAIPREQARAEAVDTTARALLLREQRHNAFREVVALGVDAGCLARGVHVGLGQQRERRRQGQRLLGRGCAFWLRILSDHGTVISDQPDRHTYTHTLRTLLLPQRRHQRPHTLVQSIPEGDGPGRRRKGLHGAPVGVRGIVGFSACGWAGYQTEGSQGHPGPPLKTAISVGYCRPAFMCRHRV